MNEKKDKIPFTLWINKTDANQLENAMENDDTDTACLIFLRAFKQGMVERR